MRNYLILLMIIMHSLIITCSYAKTPAAKITKEQSMQPFNIEAFKKNIENEYDDTWVGTDKDGNYLMQAKYDNTYVEEWSPTNSPYLYRTTYDLQGVVISKNTRLYNMNIEYQEFDKNGNVMKTVNYDAPYKFTIAQLQKKLKQAYHLDLMDTQEVRTIYRYDEDYQNNKISVYQVITYTKTNKSMLNYFYIDGDTGKTLFTTKHHMLDRKSPTPDEQFSQLLESNQITR